MNQLTHWLDASNVYGSDHEEASLLRLKSGGQLKSSNLGQEVMLPRCSKFPDLEEELEGCHGQPCNEDCFAGGKLIHFD